MGSSEPIKLLDNFESDQVYGFWLFQPKIILISCNTGKSACRCRLAHKSADIEPMCLSRVDICPMDNDGFSGQTWYICLKWGKCLLC
jgi:hypothetical protein